MKRITVGDIVICAGWCLSAVGETGAFQLGMG